MFHSPKKKNYCYSPPTPPPSTLINNNNNRGKCVKFQLCASQCASARCRKNSSPSPHPSSPTTSHAHPKLLHHHSVSAHHLCASSVPRHSSRHFYCNIAADGGATTNYVCVEKTLSCPVNNVNNVSSICQQHQHHKSTIEVGHHQHDSGGHFEFMRITDSKVNALRSDILNVKHELQRHLSQPMQTKIIEPQTAESTVKKLELENRRLRHEIDEQNRQLAMARDDIDKVKSILTDYEQKVTLLHCQTVKSAKAMQKTKDNFQRTLKQRDNTVRTQCDEIARLNCAQDEMQQKFDLCAAKQDAQKEKLRKRAKYYENANVKCHKLQEKLQKCQKRFCAERCAMRTLLKQMNEVTRAQTMRLKELCAENHRQGAELRAQLDEIALLRTESAQNLEIKSQQVQDQSETILTLKRTLKEFEDEMAKAKRKNSQIVAQMALEKDALLGQLNELEKDKRHFQSLLENVEKSTIDKRMLGQLEFEVEKQKMALCTLDEEKQRAVCAARFSAQKLLATIAQFERQTHAQRALQTVLVKMLQEKSVELSAIQRRIAHINQFLTFEPSSKSDGSLTAATSMSCYSSCSNNNN